MTINEIQDEIIEEFSSFDEWLDRYQLLVDYSKELTPFKEEYRTAHINRLQKGECSIETGFVWSDILTNLSRTSDHCSNIAGCIIDAENKNLNLHESLRNMKTDDEYYKKQFELYKNKYLSVN